MPIYEYKCENCNRIIEKIQNFQDKPLKYCPHCKYTLKKLPSKNDFHLKGNGWSKDGY